VFAQDGAQFGRFDVGDDLRADLARPAAGKTTASKRWTVAKVREQIKLGHRVYTRGLKTASRLSEEDQSILPAECGPKLKDAIQFWYEIGTRMEASG
jgi:hypothetical protein